MSNSGRWRFVQDVLNDWYLIPEALTDDFNRFIGAEDYGELLNEVDFGPYLIDDPADYVILAWEVAP